MKRIESIDHLRGVMALAVMIYHFVAWSGCCLMANGEMAATGTLSRLGIYAVSMFYVISGVSIAIAYRDKLNRGSDFAAFGIKRFFRLAPLFWLVCVLGLALGYLDHLVRGGVYVFPLEKAILSFTLTFGFVAPSQYITTGAWSIGNEIVFYTLFAGACFLLRSMRMAITAMLALTAATALIYAYRVIEPGADLASQWAHYVNPFNQAVLFFAGAMIGYHAEAVRRLLPSRLLWLGVAVVAAAVFVLWPTAPERVELVSSHARVVFTVCSVLFVGAFVFMRPEAPRVLARPLNALGESSYSIYLLHPIVAAPLVYALSVFGVAAWVSYSIAAVVTVVGSYLTYRLLETPFMNMGRTIAKGGQRPEPQPAP
ncbi:MAG: acyltransferase family protein [Brevundimonas sp.]|uniref:acyltransferase family protein n=1 Tax=Brevundimonas sp. TaxID=1871086 RepID=UPI0039187916